MLSLPFAFSLLLQGAMPPQGAVVAAAASEPLQAVLVDRPGDGNVWVLAPGYKARFGSDGVEFIPWFGSKAPRNHPVTFRARAATRGDRPLPWRSEVAPQVDGLRVTYDHGGVVEAWDLRPHEVEQTFTVRGHDGDGDLVVRIDVESTLPCADVADGLSFAAGGLGRVHYGDVTTFDGAGRVVRSPSRWTGTGIELRAPAAFVAAAHGAVRIDPVVRAITVDNGEDAIHPAVAYEPVTDRWLVVYERVFSARDQDIIARRYSGSGNFIEEVAVATGTRESRAPSVAASAQARQFLVVWDEDRLVGRLLRGRTRNAANTSQGSIQDLVDDDGVNVRAAAGGMAAADPNAGDYLVAFTNHNVLVTQSAVRLVRVGSNGLPSATFALSSASQIADDAAINKVRRNNSGWVVAYRSFAGGSITVHAGFVAASGNTAASFAVQTGVPGPPAVAGDGVDFLVMFSDRAGRSDHDLFGARLQRSGSGLTLGLRQNLTASESPASVAQDQFEPAVGYDGSRFTYAYHEGTIAGANDVFAASFTAGTTPIFSDRHRGLHAATSTIPERRVAIAGMAEAGGDAGRYFIVWNQAGSSSSNILGAIYDGVQPGASVQVVDTHCGVVQIGLVAENTPALGGTVRVRADNIAPASQAMLVGLPTAPITLCSAGCKLGVLPILLTVPGTALDLPIPEDPAVLGARVAVENVLVTSFLGCTSPVAFATTDTLVLTVR